MFGWLFPATCPVPPKRQAWLQHGLNWLCEEFGRHRLVCRPIILPTPKFFPDPYDGSMPALDVLFERVCGYMSVDRRRVDLHVFEDGGRSRHELLREGRFEGAAGLYTSNGSRTLIGVERSQLECPPSLVATMAHELAHVHLLGDHRVSPDSPDHEPLTDLLTLLMGLGVFTANALITESNWRGAGESGWSVGRQGYLTGPEFGFAFALWARERNELRPTWLRHLRLDVRSACKQGMRFLQKCPSIASDGSRELGASTRDDDDYVPWTRSRPAAGSPPDDDKLPWEK